VNQYWVWYLIGMCSVLGIKVSFYMHKSDPFQPYLPKIRDFFGSDSSTFTKSILCIFAELAIGSVYVNSLPMPYSSLGEMPKDTFLAIFFGGMSETLAPLLIGLVASRFSSK